VPIPIVDCSHSPNDRALIGDMIASLSEIASAGGLRVRSVFGRPGGGLRGAVAKWRWRHVLTEDHAYVPGAAIHEVGGARMGHDRRSSVLNSFNQCWDAPNVFVTDGACFPSSGHQPHTLTIMALTARACAFMIAGQRAGAS
jgi:choline dehydrogenase-like flavoprotein